MKSMGSSLVIMGTVLVISLLGLVTSLLLVMGVKIEHITLLIPWQVFHGIIILACFVGGIYQAMHFTVLATTEDTFHACLSLFPVVTGIFVIFLWVFVQQLSIRLKYKQQRENEERRRMQHLPLFMEACQGRKMKTQRGMVTEV